MTKLERDLMRVVSENPDVSGAEFIEAVMHIADGYFEFPEDTTLLAEALRAELEAATYQ